MNSTKIQIQKLLSKTPQKEYDSKRKRISLSLDKKEVVQIKKASIKVKKKPSLFVKDLVLSQINQENFLSDDIEKKLNEVCMNIRKIGNNLNQIARKANTEGEIKTKEIDLALSLIYRLEDQLISKIIKA